MSIHSNISRTCLYSFTLFLTCCFSTAISRADMSEADYQASLAVAQKKVERLKQSKAASLSLNPQSSNALSSLEARNLPGHTYRVGDRWEVAAWTFENSMARMTADPGQLETKKGGGGIFRYEVIAAKNTPGSDVVIQVTQLEEFGLKKPDPRVKTLRLLMSEHQTQSRKTYQLEDSAGHLRSIVVSPEGIHSAITRLELFPLDVPELLAAEASQPQALPALPDGLQAIASQAGYHPDLAQSVAYEQDDFFGRGMQLIWQKSEPWPAYFKNSNGVSILIRSPRSSGN